MKLIKTFLFVFVLFFFACNDKGKKQDAKSDTYENSKMTISEIESKNPKKFLKVEGRDKHNLIGQTVVKGKISNTATVVGYKDVTIKISFFSKTGTLLFATALPLASYTIASSCIFFANFNPLPIVVETAIVAVFSLIVGVLTKLPQSFTAIGCTNTNRTFL